MLEKLEPYVFAHLNCEDVTHFDSNQTLVEIKDPSTGQMIKVHKRVWLNTNKRQQHLQFLASDIFANFQRDNNSDMKCCYETWRKVLAKVNNPKFVTDPTPKSCVDEKMSGLEHAGDAILSALRLPVVRRIPHKYP